MSHTLSTEPPEMLTGLPVEAQILVLAYQRASKADSTVRAYTSDARMFQAWYGRYGLRPLPAKPGAVAAFLAHEAEAGRPPLDHRTAMRSDRRGSNGRRALNFAVKVMPTEPERRTSRSSLASYRRRRAKPRPRPRFPDCLSDVHDYAHARVASDHLMDLRELAERVQLV